MRAGPSSYGSTIRSSTERLPTLEEYETFCKNYLDEHPKSSKFSPFRDAKRVRAIAIARRGATDINQVAARFGITQHSMRDMLNVLPDHLR